MLQILWGSVYLFPIPWNEDSFMKLIIWASIMPEYTITRFAIGAKLHTSHRYKKHDITEINYNGACMGENCEMEK